MAFRTADLIKVGGFDVNLGRIGSNSLLSNEEIVVQNKIRETTKGERGYCAKSQVAHHVDVGRLRKNWFRSRMAWQAVSEVISGGGCFSGGWNLEQLRSASRDAGYESFLENLFHPKSSETFDLQLHFIRHFFGEILSANHTEDSVLEQAFSPKNKTNPAGEPQIFNSVSAQRENSDAYVYKPSNIGSFKPHIITEFDSGHKYLFDAYQLSGKVHYHPMTANPWETTIQKDLKKIKRSMNCKNRTLTFLTLDPYCYPVHKRNFERFLDTITVPVFGFIHRLPNCEKDLNGFKIITKKMSGIFVLSSTFVEIIKDTLDISNVHYIPHHPTKFKYCGSNLLSLKRELGIDDQKIVVSLLGEIRKGKGLEILLKSLKFLSAEAIKKLHFIIAGKCTDYPEGSIISALEESGCSYHALIGKTSNSRSYIYLNSLSFSRLIKTTDIGLLLYEGGQKDLASGVLSDYVWLNKSVIATAESITGQDVARYRLGYLISHASPEALADIFNDISHSMLGSNNGRLYQEFRKQIDPVRTADILSKILDENS